MEVCKKFNLKVTGCSGQTSLFIPEICENCLQEAEESGGICNHGPKNKPLVRSNLAMSNSVKSYGKRYETFIQTGRFKTQSESEVR